MKLKLLFAFTFFFAFAPALGAQSGATWPAATQRGEPAFTASTLVIAWHGVGTYNAGTDAVGLLPVSKNFALRSDNYIVPAPGLEVSTLGLQYQRAVSDFFKRPNATRSLSNWQAYAFGGIGAMTAPSPAHFAGTFGGGLNYDIAGNKTFSWNALQASGVAARYSTPDGTPGGAPGRTTELSWTLATGIKINLGAR